MHTDSDSEQPCSKISPLLVVILPLEFNLNYLVLMIPNFGRITSFVEVADECTAGLGSIVGYVCERRTMNCQFIIIIMINILSK